MFDVPAAPPARRAPPWLRPLPLILAALAILGSAFRPWMWVQINLTRACPVCDSWRAEIHPLTGAESSHAPHFFALAFCLILCARLSLLQTSRLQRGLQALSAGAMLGWAALLPGAMAALRTPPRLNMAPSFGIFGGRNLLMAGMALLAMGLLLAVARTLPRTVAAQPMPNAPHDQIAPLGGEN